MKLKKYTMLILKDIKSSIIYVKNILNEYEMLNKNEQGNTI